MLLEIGVFDAYGACFEYNKPNYIAEHNTLKSYVPHFNHPGIRPGQYTDDTQMSIAIAEVMLSDNEWSTKVLADKFVECFHRDPRQGYAGRFYEFLRKTKSGDAFLANIMPVSDKSGAAMRAGPIGLVKDKEQVKHMSEYQARITHNSDGGVLSAQAASLMVHYFYHLRGSHKQLAQYLVKELPQYKWTNTWRGKVNVLGVNCVHAAVTAIVENDNMSSILKHCVAYNGDVDTVAAIAGAAASVAEDIKQNIPQVLIDGLENNQYGRDYLRSLDTQLLTAFPRS